MGLSRRNGGRQSPNIWPGFVDAMGSLLIVLIFLLTVFMIVQSVLRDTINTQSTELDSLSGQVAQLADALGLETQKSNQLGDDLGAARAELDLRAARIASLSGELTQAQTRITSFEQQVLALISERDGIRADLARSEAEAGRVLSEKEALDTALASARSEMDAAVEAARLDAARREALEALVADLRRSEATAVETAETRKSELDAAEAARLADAAAAEALRKRLEGAETELTSMTLALEAERKRAEETLTLLAAADAASKDLDQRLAAALIAQQATAADLEAAKRNAPQAETLRKDLAAAIAARLTAETSRAQAQSEAERRAALLATAEKKLTEEQSRSLEQARQVALLNEQVAALRGQLGSLSDLLAAAEAGGAANRLQLDALGTQLNTALAQVASEQKRRAELEEAERKRLEAEKQDLERFRSEFFGQMRTVLAGREGVQVVGDRFVFSSEVLFNPGSADLAPEGRSQIARVAGLLRDAAAEIPSDIDWVLRVDGHTDNVPLSGSGIFADNWELSQARALSVVRYMQTALGFPPERMAATGFGEYRPVVSGDSPAARAQNRRIELKLTER
ncbi:peptidoglycan -binding protein [Falsigemmobacter faecalis]|uniref:Peptidoglycan-binding protein n=1 Tax=Falsigemmobacter faecalis TaxID=2488730 RepID=A0A3P3DHW7_9RHOB|nr:peptidoglycan -binding protein [Falsigemmobacter faecalis]RRH73813.1 peptidoglycan -binding protein [Falsigemmobacter faecalis]